ncbi:MAG: T9SS type A sorting domain-containing protein [Crocinitomicaceae bacterium]
MKKYLLLLFLFPFMASSQVDLSIDSVFHRSGVGGYFDKGLEYYSVPEYQYTEIEFSAITSNFGTSNATNVFLKVEVFKNGLIDTTLYSDSVDICSTCNDSLIAGSYQVSEMASFNFKYVILSDSSENILNNSDSVQVVSSFQNTDYRRDDGIQVGQISNVISNSGAPFSIGSIFEIFEDDQIKSVSIGLDTSTHNVGQLIYGSIFIYNPLDSSWAWQAQSGDYTIETSDLGNTVALWLDDCVFLSAGDKIIVAGGHYGGSDPVKIQTAQAVESGSVMFVTLAGVQSDSNSVLTNCPIVYPRMGSDYECFGSISGIQSSPSFKLYPNPASTNVRLLYDLKTSQTTEITVHDLSGKQVLKQVYLNQYAGDQELDLDVSKLNNGVYVINFTSSNLSASERLIIQK